MTFNLDAYRGRRVLLTGHTGFKGSWMSVVLVKAGAQVTGYSTCRRREPSLFGLCGVREELDHEAGDVRDLPRLLEVFRRAQPEVVIHLAAQPIVRESYRDPAGTYGTNVMGTVNLMEAVRQTPSVRSVLNVTTDKVYLNREWAWGYRENERLDGFDPYSNSKSCSELVTACYRRSFFADGGPAVSTARAGNVIGGGDFAADRIIPDCVRAAVRGEEIVIRNPHSTRPYQHVLEPVCAYLMIAGAQLENPAAAGEYNVGPDDGDCYETGALAEMFVRHWGGGLRWTARGDGGPHEANYLKLDCSRLKAAFGWRPRWNLDTAVAKTVEWSRRWAAGEPVRPCMERQIEEYLDV